MDPSTELGHTVLPKRKFEITASSLPYHPKEKKLQDFPILPGLSSKCSEVGEPNHRIYITDRARRQIFTHIGWGQRIEANRVEQGGLLVGAAFRDHDSRITYVVIEEALTGTQAHGSPAYLHLDHATWKEMLDRVDDILNADPECDLHVVGWYHTHPNDLPVFMSGTDRATQQRLFAADWQCALVLNPHKQVWRAFYGKDTTECQGFMMES